MGHILLIGAALAGVFAAAYNIRGNRFWRYFAIFSTVLTIAAFFHLCNLFINDSFVYYYIAENSAKDMSILYKISAVWSGKEGSLFLWSFIIAIAILSDVIRKRDTGSGVILIYAMTLAMLVFILDPFAKSEFILSDGMGMNELLRNFWMAIHPPLLFAGYAFAIIPLLQKLENLIRKKDALKPESYAMPAFIFMTLGIGTGSYWAYDVFGWGGFWGWDPVENLSFVVWIISAVYVHFVPINRRLSSAKLEIGIIYALFISVFAALAFTRGGMLSAISVHSFSASVEGVPYFAVIATATLLLLIFIYIRRAELFNNVREKKELRDEIFSLAIYALLIFAALIFVATVAAPLSSIFGKSFMLRADFYNSLSVAFAIFLSIALLLSFVKNLRFSTVRMVVTLAAFVALSLPLTFLIRDAARGILIALSIAVIFSSAKNIFPNPNFLKIARSVAHASFALMVLGFLLSENLSYTRNFRLAPGESVTSGKMDILYRKSSEDVAQIVRIRDGVESVAGSYDFAKREMKMEKFRTSSFVKDTLITPISYDENRNIYIKIDSKPFIVFVKIGMALLAISMILLFFRRENDIN